MPAHETQLSVEMIDRRIEIMRWCAVSQVDVVFLFSLEGVQAAEGGLRMHDGITSHKHLKAVFENLPGNGALTSSTAAYHRSSEPNLALLGFTQHLLKSIK